ncbi:hypothetical protein M7I_3035 [Glarea lozoyensis 74030]|uniref:Uncharacterized protein n=1 Tax=Glarea lozoyensis (strain ATCC 74030 / MF5533) TaxID=1104152 RepID=H0EKD8_GLAL7|nr:hypothetical protein M7I_3035 [Glarea lozoyensis 74030]
MFFEDAAKKTVFVWYQFLTPEQVKTYKGNPAVAAIHPYDGRLGDESTMEPSSSDNKQAGSRLVKRQVPPANVPIPDTSAEQVIHDFAAYTDLRVFSQSRGTPDAFSLKAYSWREETNPLFSQLEGSPRPRVYVFDTGMDKDSPTYRSYRPGQVEWIHPGGPEVPQEWGAYEVDRTDIPPAMRNSALRLPRRVLQV